MEIIIIVNIYCELSFLRDWQFLNPFPMLINATFTTLQWTGLPLVIE